ncbi:hypothetical protein ABZV68_33030 [Streptomyces clavifer]|uniref:hypothetical protein n=1 Tax=Streptomyces clavifer TaxID=68188 RepID=UPI0033A25753
MLTELIFDHIYIHLEDEVWEPIQFSAHIIDRYAWYLDAILGKSAANIFDEVLAEVHTLALPTFSIDLREAEPSRLHNRLCILVKEGSEVVVCQIKGLTVRIITVRAKHFGEL